MVPTIIYVLITLWAFHMGGRWTPLQRWEGVGRLRDSSGAQYGLYVRINPNVTYDHRNDAVGPCCELVGSAQVCTAGGARCRFDLTGGISGAWLRTDASSVNLTLMEPGHPKLPRQFNLAGVWFVHFLPGGNLMPNPIWSTPVPERHATVTVSWGTPSDWDSICSSLKR